MIENNMENAFYLPILSYEENSTFGNQSVEAINMLIIYIFHQKHVISWELSDY